MVQVLVRLSPEGNLEGPETYEAYEDWPSVRETARQGLFIVQ